MVGKWECPQGSGETLMMGCLSCIFFLSRSKFFSELIDVFSELIGVFGRINVSWLPLLFWCFQYGGGAKQKEWHFISWLKYAGNVGAALLTKIPRYNHNNVFFSVRNQSQNIRRIANPVQRHYTFNLFIFWAWLHLRIQPARANLVSRPTRWSLYWYLDFCNDHLSQHPDNRETWCSNELNTTFNHQRWFTCLRFLLLGSALQWKCLIYVS